ncbi:MAG: response regulator, partial [Deltaproteobacteria bacterium]|nr:response regulator [Deltaproteobacteria bacterium]
LFASYSVVGRDNSEPLSGAFENDGHHIVWDGGTFKLSVFHSINLDDKQIGTMYVVSNLNRFKKQLYNTSIVLIISMIFVLFAAQFIVRRMQQRITQPVFNLAKTARQISELGDYSARVQRSSEDEIGDLIDDFNTMLNAIEVRDSELNQHRHNLELLVQERTEELRKHRDEALAAAEAKTEFLANMSHEIRTPMNGVIGVLSLLKEAPIDEEHRRLLGTAARSADSLMFIINDILDFSKIEAGMVEFESIPFDLRELMEETVALYIDAVNSKNIDLNCFVPLDVHCFVEGDPTRLRQILTNLVSNAVKFTSQGEVTLKVELIEKRENKQLLRFSIVDTGIGIAEKSLPHLFEKFTQADGSTSRKYGGTGLGLSVCKQLVELQGGDIGVHSQVDRGTEFWFTLQIGMIPASDIFLPCDKLDGKRVLIVDDNATSRMILEHYLTACKVTTSSCESGEQALDLIKRESDGRGSFEIILIDYFMPAMNGKQLADAIKSLNPMDISSGLFILSSGGMLAEPLEHADIEAVIYKPIRRNQLYDVLARANGVKKSSKLPGSIPKHLPVLSGRVLLVDDEPINQKIAGATLERFGLQTDKASNGVEALRLLDKHLYDLVLMDIQMPEMDGYEATEIIRAREARTGHKRVTIIAMTANALESTRARCLETGMDDFISKPIKPDLLAKRLSPWLEDVKTDDPDVDIFVGQKFGAMQSQKIWDRQRALQFVDGEQDVLYDLIILFLQRKDTLLQAVEAAVNAGDPVLLDDAAHAFKGAVNHFAAAPLRHIAQELEKKGKNGDMIGSRELVKTLADLTERLAVKLRNSVSQD